MLPARLRTFFLPACLAALAVLVVSSHLEHIRGLLPCPLCFSQRLLLAVYALLSLAAVLQAPGTQGIRHYARATLGCSLAGALLARCWRHGMSGCRGPTVLSLYARYRSGECSSNPGARRRGNCCSAARNAAR